MNLVVSDTTPLNYLILIGHIEVLGSLFKKVHVPPAVIRELQHAKAPPPVAAWAHNLPAWIEIQTRHLDLHLNVGTGEDEAISLAVELGNATLLADDWKARAAAESRGLFTMGTITVLDLADAAGLLDFEDAASRLRATTFHIDSAVPDAVLAKVRARKQK